MFFSIIIPLFNRPQEIDELLGTLTLQTYKHFEVLIIEDGSTNDARQVVESYTAKLDVTYYFKPNDGQGFSRNYGFARAKGDFFIVFDSDCLIPPAYMDVVNTYITSHHIDAYGGPDAAHESFTPVQKAISYSMTSPFTTGGIRGNKAHIGPYHPRSFNMGISRAVWEQTGGFILTRLGEDIEFSIRIQKMGFKTALIPEALVYHKRRTSFAQFYKQLHFFGRARINVYKFFPNELKAVHFIPALFTFFLGITLIVNLLQFKVAGLFNVVLVFIILLIFFHAWHANKSAKVAFLSIIAAFIQLSAYGLGFIQDLWKRVIFNRT